MDNDISLTYSSGINTCESKVNIARKRKIIVLGGPGVGKLDFLVFYKPKNKAKAQVHIFKTFLPCNL